MPRIQPLEPQLVLRTLLALFPLMAVSMRTPDQLGESAGIVLLCVGITFWTWQYQRIAQALCITALLVLGTVFTIKFNSGSDSIYSVSLFLSALAALILTQPYNTFRVVSGVLSLTATGLSVAALFSFYLEIVPLNELLAALSLSSENVWASTLTAGMVFLQLQNWPGRNHPLNASVLTPIPLLLGVILTVYITMQAERQYHHQLHEQTLQRNGQLSNDLLNRLENQNLALERLAQQWVQMREMPKALWQRQAQLLMQDFNNFYSIEWIDNDLVIRWLEAPFADPNIIDFRFEPEHPAHPYLMLARTTQQQVTSGIYRLIPGDLGFTVYTPIFIDNDQQQGFLVSVYQLEPFISQILRNPIYADFSLRVLFRNQPVYSSPSFQPGAPLTTQVLSPAPLNWQLQLQPDLQQANGHPATILLILVSGLFMSMLLGLSLWVISRYLRQKNQVKVSNQLLKQEIAQRQTASETLQASNHQLELFYDLINQSRDALLVVNPENHELIYYNSSTYKVLGYDEASFLEATKRTTGELKQALTELIERAQTCRRRFGSAVYEMEIPRQDLTLLPVEVSVRTVKTEEKTYLTIVLHDVTAHHELQRRLLDMATKDALTQISNRRQFDTKLNTEWARLLRIQQPLSLLIMDVDHFKKFNDTLGHQQGDSCLRTIADLLQSALGRASDCAARYGGEEFAAILPHTDHTGAEQVAERIHRKLAQAAIPHPDSSAQSYVTLSIGICTLIPSAENSVDKLIRLADQALYQAKDAGRNCTIIAALEDQAVLEAPPIP